MHTVLTLATKLFYDLKHLGLFDFSKELFFINSTSIQEKC